MRGAPRSILFTLAAACWVAAGPAGVTVREVLLCHHAAHHMGEQHPATPPQGPCFCDQMTGGLDVAVSTAVPTPPVPAVTLRPSVVVAPPASPCSSPPSPTYSPTPPPPNALG
jgi:hypothetical protein